MPLRRAPLALALLTLGALAIAARAATPATARAPFAMDNGVGRGSWSPEKQASTLRELGYDGISYNYTKASDIPVWQAELAKHQQTFHAIYFPLRLDGDPLPADFTTALGHLENTGTVLWTIIPQPTAKNLPAAELESAAITRLRDLADRAAQHGLRVALYPHKGFYLANAEHALALVQKADRKNIGLTVNLCHELAAGNGPRLTEVIRRVAPALSMVSLNGATDRPGPAWENYIKLLGDGDYDVAALLRTLRAVGYTGPIGIQFYNLKGDPRTNLETTIRAWQALQRGTAHTPR